jgi:hypothetical protein
MRHAHIHFRIRYAYRLYLRHGSHHHSHFDLLFIFVRNRFLLFTVLPGAKPLRTFAETLLATCFRAQKPLRTFAETLLKKETPCLIYRKHGVQVGGGQGGVRSVLSPPQI